MRIALAEEQLPIGLGGLAVAPEMERDLGFCREGWMGSEGGFSMERSVRRSIIEPRFLPRLPVIWTS
jgi:hypothetical protein